jgi:hypothetical protein
LTNETSSILSSESQKDIICSSKDMFPNIKLNYILEKKQTKIFYPKNSIEIRKIITNNKCVVKGHCTSYNGQIIPKNYENIIDMLYFDKIREINPYKNYIIVDSCTPFFKIIKELEKYNKELLVFPLQNKNSTPGGFLSQGLGIGIGSNEYGFFSNTILELELVSANGEIIIIKNNENVMNKDSSSFCNKENKQNITDYDVSDFYHSEGTLGIFTKFKLAIKDKINLENHMYGFEDITDLQRFFENHNSINSSYIFNNVVFNHFNSNWKLKGEQKYSVIIKDYNTKTDHTREFREDLASLGVGFIYPEWICQRESKRIHSLELINSENKKNILVADSVGELDKGLIGLRIANKYNIPSFSIVSKSDSDSNLIIKTKYYFNLRSKLDLQSSRNIMSKIFNSGNIPYTRGLFFEEEFEKSNQMKKMKHIKIKYNVTNNLSPRNQLLKMNFFDKTLSKIYNLKGCDLW